MPDGMQYPQPFMAPPRNLRSLQIEQVPNITTPENIHHGHRKRAIAPPKNHFTVGTDYTNSICDWRRVYVFISNAFQN